MEAKVKLFKYRKGSTINVYELDGYYDYYYGYMLPHTGYIKYFEILLTAHEKQDNSCKMKKILHQKF